REVTEVDVGAGAVRLDRADPSIVDDNRGGRLAGGQHDPAGPDDHFHSHSSVARSKPVSASSMAPQSSARSRNRASVRAVAGSSSTPMDSLSTYADSRAVAAGTPSRKKA